MIPVPVVRCRHGLKIKEVWWECDDCIAEGGYSAEDMRHYKKLHEEHKREMARNEAHQRAKEHEEWEKGRPKRAIGQVISYIGMAVVFYFIVGLGGCVVRVVTTDWIGKEDINPPHLSYVREAVIAFFIVVAIGFYRAVKTLRKS